jgi:hypothetical protein
MDEMALLLAAGPDVTFDYEETTGAAAREPSMRPAERGRTLAALAGTRGGPAAAMAETQAMQLRPAAAPGPVVRTKPVHRGEATLCEPLVAPVAAVVTSTEPIATPPVTAPPPAGSRGLLHIGLALLAIGVLSLGTALIVRARRDGAADPPPIVAQVAPPPVAAAAPEPEPAAVNVLSVPAGAQVLERNDHGVWVKRGTTPYRFTFEGGEIRAIELSHPGFASSRRKIRAADGPELLVKLGRRRSGGSGAAAAPEPIPLSDKMPLPSRPAVAP